MVTNRFELFSLFECVSFIEIEHGAINALVNSTIVDDDKVQVFQKGD